MKVALKTRDQLFFIKIKILIVVDFPLFPLSLVMCRDKRKIPIPCYKTKTTLLYIKYHLTLIPVIPFDTNLCMLLYVGINSQKNLSKTLKKPWHSLE